MSTSPPWNDLFCWLPWQWPDLVSFYSGHPFLVSFLDSLSFIYIDKICITYLYCHHPLLEIITLLLFWHHFPPCVFFKYTSGTYRYRQTVSRYLNVYVHWPSKFSCNSFYALFLYFHVSSTPMTSITIYSHMILKVVPPLWSPSFTEIHLTSPPYIHLASRHPYLDHSFSTAALLTFWQDKSLWEELSCAW